MNFKVLEKIARKKKRDMKCMKKERERESNVSIKRQEVQESNEKLLKCTKK